MEDIISWFYTVRLPDSINQLTWNKHYVNAPATCVSTPTNTTNAHNAPLIEPVYDYSCSILVTLKDVGKLRQYQTKTNNYKHISWDLSHNSDVLQRIEGLEGRHKNPITLSLRLP